MIGKDLYDDLLRLSFGFEGDAWIAGLDDQGNYNFIEMEEEIVRAKELPMKKSMEIEGEMEKLN